MVFKAKGFTNLYFKLMVDGQDVAYMRNADRGPDPIYQNSITMTRNLHLERGQVVTLDLSFMERVVGKEGLTSWFSGHLVYSN